MEKKIISKLVSTVIAAAVVLGAGFFQTAQAITGQESQNANKNAAACVRYDPTVLISPARQATHLVKANTFTVIVRNNDSAACGESVFELSSVAADGWKSSLNSSSISIAPRVRGSVKMTVTGPQTAKPGNYMFAVTAVNSFDYSRQAGATASLYVPPSHKFSLSRKVADSGEINISNDGDLRWNGLVILSAEESNKMEAGNMGFLASITGADDKVRNYDVRPENGLLKVTEPEEDGLAFETRSQLTGPDYIADGGNSNAYASTGRKWVQNDPQVIVSVNAAGSGLTAVEMQNAVTAATETWDAATNQNLFSDGGAVVTTAVQGKYDKQNVISFIQYKDGCNALASAGTWYKMTQVNGYYPIVESDIAFNTKYSWGTTGASGKYDFQSVALHELGHTIGLGDLYNKTQFKNDTRQVMHYYTGIKRVLGNGDRTGVWTLYDGNVSADTIVPSVSLTAPAANTTYIGAQTVIISADATDNIGVSRVEFYDGTVLLATDTDSPYNYNWAITGANNGARSLTAKAYDASGNSKVSDAVNITINISTSDTAKPTVSLTSPANNTIYIVAQTVAVNANATDNMGVNKVEFYVDGVLKATDTDSSYNYSWPITASSNGTHSLTAKAYDAAGNNTTSAVVNVTINIPTADTNAPAVSITAPSGNTTYTAAQTVTVAASATDNVGISKVEFYVDGVLKSIDTASAYSYNWPITAADNGARSLTAKAYDTSGNSKVSAAVNVTVNIAVADIVKPVASITAPANDETVSGAFSIAAAATDNVSVSKVEFYIDGILKSTDVSSPYIYSWNTATAANGAHSIYAKAYDAAGNAGVSATINVTVSNTVTSDLTVDILTPLAGSTVSGTVPVTVNKVDNSSAYYLMLYIDGVQVKYAIPRYASFNYSWNTAGYANGPHTLKALIGRSGQIPASKEITVMVNN